MASKFRTIGITVLVTLGIVLMVGALVTAKIVTLLKTPVVRVEKPERGELIELVSAPGEIEPKTKVEISAKLTARIVALPYEEGDRVTAGNPDADPPMPASVLVKLDAKDLESQLRQAEASRAAQAAQIEVEKARISSQQANLVGLEASLQQAQRDLARQAELLQSEDISQATFDQTRTKADELKSQYTSAARTLEAAQLNLVVLQHQLEAADARIAQAEEALTYTTIASPIDGVVTRLNAEVGELVVTGTMNNPGTVIMEVADLSQMLVVAQVDEADVGKLRVGQKARVHVDAFPDDELQGVVDSIALAHTMSYTMTKYFRTEILLQKAQNSKFEIRNSRPQGGLVLHSGLTAHVDIETLKHADVLKVPTQAVLGREVDTLPRGIRKNSPHIDPAKAYATVVYRCHDEKAVVTPVKIGRSDLTHTIILSGLTEQDRIVVGPYKVLEKLKHGKRLRDEREEEARKQAERAKMEGDPNQSQDDGQG